MADELADFYNEIETVAASALAADKDSNANDDEDDKPAVVHVAPTSDSTVPASAVHTKPSLLGAPTRAVLFRPAVISRPAQRREPPLLAANVPQRATPGSIVPTLDYAESTRHDPSSTGAGAVTTSGTMRRSEYFSAAAQPAFTSGGGNHVVSHSSGAPGREVTPASSTTTALNASVLPIPTVEAPDSAAGGLLAAAAAAMPRLGVKRRHVRTCAGETWVDPTLAEWPESACCGLAMVA